MTELTDQDRAILDFERGWWRFAGAKEQAIREQLGMKGTAYYQQLNRLLESPAALVHDPMLVHRLERIRNRRKSA
jgi:hypothetical protein